MDKTLLNQALKYQNNTPTYSQTPYFNKLAKQYQKEADSAKYTKPLLEKKPVTIRFSVQDLAKIKAKAKSQGIGYQNLIQALVANYVNGKISLKI